MENDRNSRSDHKRIQRILARIAFENGVTPAQVHRDIDGAIQQALTLSKLEGNREALEQWEQIPCAGEIPTAEEFILWLSKKL